MNSRGSHKDYLLAIVALLPALCPSAVTAQVYPNKPVRLMTGSAPGGGGDLTARAIAHKLAGAFGQQVIVDNRPGATGMIANQLLAKVNMAHVPYRGSTAAVVDLIAGRADVMFGLVPVLNPYIREGKLRALAFTANKRNVLLPKVPAIGETLPCYVVESWEGVVAPAGTARDIIARLHQEITAAVRSAGLRELWKNRGVDTVTGSADAFSTRLKEDYLRYGDLLKRLGMKGG